MNSPTRQRSKQSERQEQRSMSNPTRQRSKQSEQQEQKPMSNPTRQRSKQLEQQEPTNEQDACSDSAIKSAFLGTPGNGTSSLALSEPRPTDASGSCGRHEEVARADSAWTAN